MEVLLAKDVAPKAFGGASDEDSDDYDYDSSEEREEDVVDDLEYDVYNLTACNTHPFICGDDSREDAIRAATERCTQLLVNKIFNCEIEKAEIGPLCVLPEETFIFPREKRIPEAKPETRWEKFAKTKGILKRKKDRMVFDETLQEWRPRYGYKRANADIDDAIVEIKEGSDPFTDPWADNRKAKKARVDKNLQNQLKNKIRAGIVKGKGKKKSYDPVSVPGIPLDINDKKKRGKDGVRRALELVQHSTQSMGRFDEMREGEPKRKMQGRRRSFRDNSQPMDSERDIMKRQIRIVDDKVQKKANGVTNSLKAYEGIIPDAPSDSFKQRKGKNKAPKEGGKRKRKN